MIEAEVELEALFDVPDNLIQVEQADDMDLNAGRVVYDEEFAYHRTLSRLKEMQTKEYQEESARKNI